MGNAFLQRWVVLGVVLAALTLRLYRLDFQDIWWDEARNMDVASRPLTQIAGAPELDIHPPLYFYLLHGWLALFDERGAPAGAGGMVEAGRAAFVARFMSLWFGVLLVPLMYALGRRAGGCWTGFGAALSAAFLPFLVGEAQEARMYTVGLVWMAAAGWQIVDGQWKMVNCRWQVARPRRLSAICSLHWLWFSLFSALALLTHYAAIFALVALWGWAIGAALVGDLKTTATAAAGIRPALLRAVIARWPRICLALLAGLLTVLFCLPGLPVALRQISTYRNPNLTVPTVGAYLVELAHVYGLGERLDAFLARPLQWLLFAWLAVGWLLTVATRRISASAHQRTSETPSARRQPPFAIRHWLFAICWAILPLAIYYLIIRDRATFASRYISLALPGWLLLGGLALRGWTQARAWSGGLAALLLVAMLAPGLVGDLTDARFFREDTRGLVAWLKTQATPDDLILVDQRYPFGLYYERWNNAADGGPPSQPASLAPAQYLFVDINTVAARLNLLAAGRSHIFWVRWFESDTDPRGAVPFLLEKFGTPLGERAFRGYTVAWYAIGEGRNTIAAPTFELVPALAGPPADFSGQVRLVEAAFGGRGAGVTSTIAETRAPVAPADKAIWAVVRWARLPDTAAPLKATVVLEDAYGTIVGYDDRPLLNDRHLAPANWAAGDQPLGVYLIHPGPATPPGRYTLKLAAYNPTDLRPLPVSGAAARGSFVTLGQVELIPATAPPSAQLTLAARADFAWHGLRLLGRGPLPEQIGPGDRLAFDLYWQAQQGDLADMWALFDLRPQTPGPPDLAPLRWEAPLVESYAVTRWTTGTVLRGRQQWQLDPQLPAGAYALGLRLVERPSRSESPAIPLGIVTVAGRPHGFELPSHISARSGAIFGELARLVGYELQPAAFAAKPGFLTVVLYWQAAGTSKIPYKVSAQLLDKEGVLRAQRDQTPGDGAFPTTGWVEGEILTDLYHIELRPDLPAGSYTVSFSMYDPVTLARLPVTTADGATVGDALRLTVVEVR